MRSDGKLRSVVCIDIVATIRLVMRVMRNGLRVMSDAGMAGYM